MNSSMAAFLASLSLLTVYGEPCAGVLLLRGYAEVSERPSRDFGHVARDELLALWCSFV